MLKLIRPSPGPRKRQSAQCSDCRGHNNRISAAVRGPHRPSSRNPNDKGKAVRSREKKDQQNKGKEEKVSLQITSWSWTAQSCFLSVVCIIQLDTSKMFLLFKLVCWFESHLVRYCYFMDSPGYGLIENKPSSGGSDLVNVGLFTATWR